MPPQGIPSLDLRLAPDPRAAIEGFLDSGGSPSALGAAIQAANLAPRGNPVATADFNGDGLDDVAIALPTSGEDPQLTGSLFVFGCAGSGYSLVYSGPTASESGMPRLHAAEDLNGDAAAELLVGWETCGAHTCFEAVQALVWRGSTLENRFAGSTSDLPNPTVEVRAGAAGETQIIVTGTGVSSVGAGPPRQIQRWWAWDPSSQAFTLQEETKLPSNFRAHVLFDAEEAARQGRYEDALGLYYRVITDSTLTDWVNPETERADLTAYAMFREMVTYVEMGDLGDAQVGYGILQNSYPAGAEGHAYAELASAYWETYQPEENAAKACAAARAFAADHTATITDPLYFGYSNPTIQPSDVCPAS